MSSSQLVGTVRIRCTCTSLLKENAERVLVLFAARLQEKSQSKPGESAGVPQETTADDDFVEFGVYTTGPPERVQNTDLIPRLQKYVDDICGEGCAGAVAGGEDSSYDSDYEIDPPSSSNSARPHQDVSRTTSDTLAAEYADYVQTNPQIATADATPGYTARVEFALKLGYTEKLVQAALHKLGPSPAQNELLAELIKLGAQKGGGSSCDTSPSEGTLDVPELIAQHQQLLQQQTINEQQLSVLGGHALLRPIVIDGSNVAMSHGNKEVFSCRGIKLCVDWFKSRGHKEITVFVPKWRKEQPRADNPIKDQEVLAELEKERLLVFTPSRLVGGKRMVCYDDRYVLKLAAEVDGIVVSNDNYRDLCQESTEFRKVVEERILMYSFVNDRFMPPDDPLGRSGPTLDNFLRIQPPLGPKKGPLGATLSSSSSSSSCTTIGGGLGADAPPPPPLCPYGKKCTYGNKCKYHHPERGPYPHKSVTERLSEHAQRHLLARTGDGAAAAVASATAGDGVRKTPLGRTRSNIPPPKENQHAIVSKSRSVDNVGGCTTLYQPLQPLQQQQQGVSVGENLHRKLQRQLTLNPTSDPRLIRRYVNQQQQQNSQQQQQQQQAATAPPQQQYMAAPPGSWDLHHQHVTRIASAPESYHPWPPNTAAAVVSQQQQQQHTMRHMQRMSSCSDPQLNVWPPPSLWGPSGASALSHTPTPSQQQPPLTKNNNHSSSNNNNSLQHEDARRKLHYHLAAIFPEEQVTQAMQMYPDETNPQKICAAILSMFPNKT